MVRLSKSLQRYPSSVMGTNRQKYEYARSRSDKNQLSNDTGRTDSNSLSQTINCYIQQADNRVFHVAASVKALGEEILHKICNMLGIVEEVDYFGLTYQGSKNEMIWVNLRNRLSKQIPGQAPYHLCLRVKYFVQPHVLLLDETKRQFFLNTVQHIQSGEWGCDLEFGVLAQMLALITHAQFGAYNATTTPCKYALFWPHSGNVPSDVLKVAAEYHRNLQNSSSKQAQYEAMQLAHEQIPLYGSHLYDVKSVYDKQLKIAVGPECIALCSPEGRTLARHLYSSVNTVTLSTRVVNLNLMEDDGSIKSKLYQLATSKAAHSLYRCITEVHAFFRCDSVSPDLLGQTSRDFRDTLNFLFDHNAAKDFAFDVRLTAREVYDQARRHLYRLRHSAELPKPPLHRSRSLKCSERKRSSLQQPLFDLGDEESDAWEYSLRRIPPGTDSDRSTPPTDSESSPVGNSRSGSHQQELQECLRRAHQCQICCDRELQRVFIPCGHIVCCDECANRVEDCPLCRAPIQVRHPMFLPEVDNSEVIPSSDMPVIAEKRSHKQARPRSMYRPTSTKKDLFRHQSVRNPSLPSSPTERVQPRRNATDSRLPVMPIAGASYIDDEIEIESPTTETLNHSVIISARSMNTSDSRQQLNMSKGPSRTISEPRRPVLRRTDKEVVSPQVHIPVEANSSRKM